MGNLIVLPLEGPPLEVVLMQTDIRARRLRERVLELVAAVADPTRTDHVFREFMSWVGQLHTHYSFPTRP